MRRPLAPLPDRPNPTDPGDAADLSTPQGISKAFHAFGIVIVSRKTQNAVACKIRLGALA